MLTGLDLAMTLFLCLVMFCGVLLGLIRMGLITLTFLAAGTAARLGAPILAPYLSQFILSGQLRIFAGGLLLMVGVCFLVFFLGKILHRIKRRLRVVWLDRLLGGALSLLVGWVVLALALSLITRVPVPAIHQAIEASFLVPVILDPLPELFLLER